MKSITILSAQTKYKGKNNILIEPKHNKQSDKNKLSGKKNERTDRNI